jgi:hypothetical protein
MSAVAYTDNKGLARDDPSRKGAVSAFFITLLKVSATR